MSMLKVVEKQGDLLPVFSLIRNKYDLKHAMSLSYFPVVNYDFDIPNNFELHKIEI